MSFGLPSLKVKPENACNIAVQEGPFGVPDVMVAGLSASKPKLNVAHPLQISEKNYKLNEEKMNLAMLRNTQGLHAPLKLTMEMKFAKMVGRLPFLPSSQLQLDVLTGRDIDIDLKIFLTRVNSVKRPANLMQWWKGLLACCEVLVLLFYVKNSNKTFITYIQRYFLFDNIENT